MWELYAYGRSFRNRYNIDFRYYFRYYKSPVDEQTKEYIIKLHEKCIYQPHEISKERLIKFYLKMEYDLLNCVIYNLPRNDAEYVIDTFIEYYERLVTYDELFCEKYEKYPLVELIFRYSTLYFDARYLGECDQYDIDRFYVTPEIAYFLKEHNMIDRVKICGLFDAIDFRVIDMFNIRTSNADNILYSKTIADFLTKNIMPSYGYLVEYIYWTSHIIYEMIIKHIPGKSIEDLFPYIDTVECGNYYKKYFKFIISCDIIMPVTKNFYRRLIADDSITQPYFDKCFAVVSEYVEGIYSGKYRTTSKFLRILSLLDEGLSRQIIKNMYG